MLRRHQSTVSMFYQKAKTSQSQNPLKILAAYYGRKSAIKDFVNDKIRANEELQSSSLTELLQHTNLSTPKFVLDVTIPVCFKLDKEGL